MIFSFVWSAAGCFINNGVSVSETTSSMLSSYLPFLMTPLNNFLAVATAIRKLSNKT